MGKSMKPTPGARWGGYGSLSMLMRVFVYDAVIWCMGPLLALRSALVGDSQKSPLTLPWTITKAVLVRLLQICSVDKRSVTLFRIMMALSTIWDLGQRYVDLKSLYSDEGVLSRQQVMEYGLHNYYWSSIYLSVGHTPYVFALMTFNMVILFLWLFGWHTRFMGALSWWFLVGLQGRQILVGHAGDCLHRILVLLCVFVPTADYYSIDTVLNNKRKARDEGADEAGLNARLASHLTFGFPALALIFEFVMMYYSAYWHKTGLEWTTTYRATFLAVQLEFFARPAALWVGKHPWLCYQLTRAVKYWQWWGNWGLLSPVLFEPLRLFCALGWQAMHLGFAVSLRLGTFAWTTFLGPVVLYPPMLWDHVVNNVLDTPERRGLRVYYRRGCDRCATIAHSLSVFCMGPTSTLIPADCCSCSGCKEGGGSRRNRAEELLASSSGWLVAENTTTGRLSSGYDAFLDVMEQAPLWWIFFPMLLRMRVVLSPVFAAVHSHSWGDTGSSSSGTCVTTQSADLRRKAAHPPMWREFISLFVRVVKVVALNIGAAFCLYVFVTYNLSNIGVTKYGPSPSVRPIIWATMTDQFWGVFAPRPPDSWWWYNIEAELHNGTKAEIFAGGKLWSQDYTIPHTYDKPDPVRFYQGFKHHRWFKYFENGYNMHSKNQEIRLSFGRWLCREYLSKYRGDDRLYKFKLWMVGDRLNPQDELGPRISTGKRVLWDHKCYDKPPSLPQRSR